VSAGGLDFKSFAGVGFDGKNPGPNLKNDLREMLQYFFPTKISISCSPCTWKFSTRFWKVIFLTTMARVTDPRKDPAMDGTHLFSLPARLAETELLMDYAQELVACLASGGCGCPCPLDGPRIQNPGPRRCNGPFIASNDGAIVGNRCCPEQTVDRGVSIPLGFGRPRNASPGFRGLH